MTEQEAKALALELESHATWRVVRVWEEWAFHWAISLERRDDPTAKGVLHGNPGAKMLAELLQGKHLYHTSS